MLIINRFNPSVFRLTSIWMTKTTKRFPFPSEALYKKTAIPIPSQVFLEGDRWQREQARHRNAGLKQPPRSSSSPLFQHHSGGDLAQVDQDVFWGALGGKTSTCLLAAMWTRLIWRRALWLLALWRTSLLQFQNSQGAWTPREGSFYEINDNWKRNTH